MIGVVEFQFILWVEEEIDGKSYWKVVDEIVCGDYYVCYEGLCEDYFNGLLKMIIIGIDVNNVEKNFYIKEELWVIFVECLVLVSLIELIIIVDYFV